MTETLPLPSDVLFARHGRFRGNVAMTTTGPEALLISQIPASENFTVGLDEVGQAQARRLGGQILRFFPAGFEACLTSDFTRVIESADLALPGTSTIIRTELQERERGDVARIPKARLLKEWPEEAARKAESPTLWRPPNGESLFDKAAALRGLLPLMGYVAPDQPLPVMTSGEVVIAARSMQEFGNMDDDALRRGLAPGWPALEVDNAQFDLYTRRENPTDPMSSLSPTFGWVISVRAAEEEATDSGWIRIER